MARHTLLPPALQDRKRAALWRFVEVKLSAQTVSLDRLQHGSWAVIDPFSRLFDRHFIFDSETLFLVAVMRLSTIFPTPTSDLDSPSLDRPRTFLEQENTVSYHEYT